MSKKIKEAPYIISRLNHLMMNYRVYIPGTLERLLVCLGLFVLGGCVSWIFYGGLFQRNGYPTTATYISNTVIFFVVGILAVRFFFPLYIKRCVKKQRLKLKLQFGDMLSSLSASISSGSNIRKAFEDVLDDLLMQYREEDFIVKETREILGGIAQNINLEVMIKDFAKRSDDEDILCFADVFEVCYRKGGDLKSVMHHTHTVIHEKMEIMDEIETKLTSNKMQHNVMSLMPIAVVAMLRFTNDTFADNFTTPLGVLTNTAAIGIFIVSYYYGLKICDVKV